jgi:hypothetical protein
LFNIKQLVKPSHIFVPVPNDDLDFKLHVFLFFFCSIV